MTEKALSAEIALLLERLEGEEALDLEFKAARGGLPQSLWSTVSAFANTRGGWVVLGIVERDGGLVAEGVPRPQELLQQLADQVRNRQRISYPAFGATDLRVESAAGQKIVVVRVPPAPRRARPVYIGGSPYGGTYTRVHTGDYGCAEPEVKRMMREASDLAADQVVIPWCTWTDLDGQTFKRYRRWYQTNLPDSPHNTLDDEAFLRAIGGSRHDRESGLDGVTVAGLLMFGTDGAIREWRSRHMIDFRVVPREPSEWSDLRWSDRLIWEGNLFGAFETIYRRLVADLPVPFALENGRRTDQSPRHVAVREALINLLVHTDYRETAPSLIVRSDDGYLFRNPGSSRVIDLDSPDEDRADARNPELVRMFRFIGLAEEAGTGIPRLIQAWHALGYQRPEFDPGTQRYEFAVRLRYSHLLSEEDRTWLDSLEEALSEAEQLALVAAHDTGEIDNQTLRRVTGQHPADVTRVLRSLRNRDLLEMFGSGRGAWYELSPRAQRKEENVAAISDGATAQASSGGMGTNSPGLPPSSPGIEASSGGFSPSSGGFSPSSGGIDDKSERPTSSLEEKEHDLKRIAAPIRNRRHPDPHDRDEIIVELCRVRPLTLRELADLLGRAPDHLRRVIRDLIRAGRLTYLHPKRLQHPDQRYVALDDDDGLI